MFKGIIIAVIGAAAYGFISLFTKNLVNLSVNSDTILVSRFMIIFMVAGTYLVIRKKLVRPSGKQIKDLLIYGVIGYGGAIFLLAESYIFMPMSQATMIHFSYPLFVALFMVVFYREKMTWVKAAALFLTCLGIAFLMEFNFTVNIVGLLIALLSGAAFGFYMVSVSESSIKDLDPVNLLFYLALVVVLVFGTWGLIKGELHLVNLGSAVYMSMLGVAALSIIGIGFSTVAIHTIGPTYAAMICVLEPVVALLCGVAVFQEPLTAYSLLGSLMMLAVILLIAFEGYLRKKKIRKRE
ncbi:DMT family transporter [Eubacterium sp. 1001713B170207_170306_E7]|uniref:DMT family transporter n=1 Tax=Eubacterium sp. 1001713B170207_170306_E7 TaxID=2787097 RepID=UPI00189BAC64|nr:DMT family transporter [Eubacterium sp. 1001713B170207_170306_E7]